MGIRGGVGLLLFLLFSHLIFFSASSSPSVPSQENNLREGVADEGGITAAGGRGGRHQLIHGIKVGHGHGAGGGGEAAASRSPGSTNGDSTSAAHGGAAVIPVYTAGAVNNHRPNNAHHGAASPNLQSLEPLNLCASVFAILVLHLYLYCSVWIWN